MSAGARTSVAHLLGLVDATRLQVDALVRARRASDPSIDDPFLGLYLTDERIDQLLHGERSGLTSDEAAARRREVEARADADAARAEPSRLRGVAERFGLDLLDVELLVVALAPDVDDRFERFYGYLHDDVTRRRASVGLALALAGVPPASADGRHRFHPSGPLLAGGLVDVEEVDRPFLTRSLRVPDRVTAHLLGGDAPDPLLAPLLADVEPDAAGDGWSGAAARLAPALARERGLVYLRDPSGGAAEVAASAAAAAGRPALVLDLGRLADAGPLADVARAAGREARLRGGALVAGPVEELAAAGDAAVRAVAELEGVVVLHGERTWDPSWARAVPLQLALDPPTPAARAARWKAALDGAAGGVDAAAATAQFRLAPRAVRRSATAARLLAELDGTPVAAHHVRAAARQQNAARLEHLARRVVPGVGWADLVLPPATLRGLHQLADRARHREQVLGAWRMRPGGGRGTGVTGLFTGESGTGKTMSAEVVAADLGLDLYVVDLSTVVDKYVGETEKNLDRVFGEADGVNGVLLFDEADALFGQRSEVRDSHDRYANLEIAYLLQRMESFDGVAILATNLRANIDDAFARRLDAVVDFPQPDVAGRRALWGHALSTLPVEPDVDLDFCAGAFELAGGNIRSIATTAAYRAAASGRPVSMEDVIRGVAEEYRKLGRLCLATEFGPYHPLAIA